MGSLGHDPPLHVTRSTLLIPLAIAVFSQLASAQIVYLDEPFDSGNFPPTGWIEDNNGVSLGWAPGTGRAVHADWYGLNDNSLISPSLDLSAGTVVGLHLTHDQLFARYRDQNEIEISLDGGVTFSRVLAIDGQVDGVGIELDVDLTAWAGQADVQLGFRYVGDFANEWSIDHVLVDDFLPEPPPTWPELPTDFIAWEGYCERFDELVGVIPPHFAANSVDEASRYPDLDGWCNIGQLAPCTEVYSGLASLELGLNPNTINFHNVANAMIIGFDGSAIQNTAFEMMVWQAGEELDPDDGVFVSVDGETWHPLRTDWVRMTAGTSYQKQWRRVSGDLATAGLNLSGNFYMAISQADDFPFGGQDGVAIDNLCCGGSVVPLRYEITNLIGGSVARFEVTGLDRDAFVSLMYSFAGPGPTTTPFGLADLGSPYATLATVDADRNGRAEVALSVPMGLVGRTVWTQAVEILGASGRFSNPLEVTVQ